MGLKRSVFYFKNCIGRVALLDIMHRSKKQSKHHGVYSYTICRAFHPVKLHICGVTKSNVIRQFSLQVKCYSFINNRCQKILYYDH